MAKVKGICKNIDEDCTFALDKTVQEVEKIAPFVCEGCGKPLFPLQGKAGASAGGKNNKKPLFIGVIGVAVVAIGVAAYFLLGTGSSEKELLLPTSTDTSIVDDTSAKVGTVTQPEPEPDDLKTYLSQGTVQSGSEGSGKISTEYGNYTGDLKDGKANGNGAFQAFKRVRISRHDERIAEEGDYLVGQFENNEVVQVKWFDRDKQQKGTIIIGRKGVE
jgi:hypothetical protein